MTETFSFGEWVSQRRKALDLGQRELAMRASCAVATIKKIEADERRPSRELAELLGDALRVPQDRRETFLECARGLRAIDALAEMNKGSDQQGTPSVDTAVLPVSITPFIGRMSELAQIQELLAQPACRLLTLVGAGGVGKTRLAMEAARAQREVFADGVIFVPLAALNDASLIPMSIAHSLRLTLLDSPETQLLTYLGTKAMLLVLDTCEQFGDGVAWLSTLLAHAPGIKLLATSRERLQLAEEWVFTVPELDETQAVDLFVQTTRRVMPNFDFAGQQSSVADICTLVEKLPLAIELAAGWTPFLSCAQIADHIQRDIDFLSANVRNVPERHRSVRAVFDHSWRLLSSSEQAALMHLSVFRGGWTADESEPIAGATLTVLRALMEKSLVRITADGRYDLHELTRQYAADKLRRAGQEIQARRRHSDVYLTLAAHLDAQLYGPNGIAAFARFDQEQDNLRAGLSWALEAGEMDIARHYVDHLFFFWQRRGHWSEGEHWSKAAVGQAQEADSILLCWTLISAAIFTALRGRFGESHPYLERFVAMAQRLEDPETMFRVLLLLGQALADVTSAAKAFEDIFTIGAQIEVLSKGIGSKELLLASAHFLYGDRLRFVGRTEEAIAHYRQSLERFRQLGNVDMIAYPIGNLGRLALQAGRVKEAYDRFAESVAISRAVGNRVGIADWLQQLGNAALAMGDLEQAEMCYEEALALYEEMGNQRAYPDVLADLGYVALVKGDMVESKRYLHESLAAYLRFFHQQHSLQVDLSDFLPPEFVHCLQATGLLATSEGNFERAVTLFGAAAMLHTRTRHKLDLGLPGRVADATKTIHAQLSDDVYNSAWEAGQSMSLEETIAYALEG